MLFFRVCQLGENDHLQFMNKSIKLANSINDSIIKNRAYQLISTIYCDAACLENIEVNGSDNRNFYLERAFYWASVISDLGEMRCSCGSESYKSLKCNVCGDICSETGYKNDAYNYIFKALEKKHNAFEITKEIKKKVFETNDVNTGWDGTFNGENLPATDYSKSFQELISEIILLSYNETSVENYLKLMDSNLDDWANKNLIKSRRFL